MNVQFRNATRTDLRHILGWAASEGWNPGQEDAEAFFAADPEGFFVAERAGEVIAAISVVNHSDRFSFLGLYICTPDCRGQGIGYSLWKHALEHAGGRTVGLDGVAEQEANYAKSGFVSTGATMRYEGRLQAKASPAVRLATPADVDALAALDGAANGVHRPLFLNRWTALEETRKTVVLQDNNRITGFATIRICDDGAKIGPIIAPNVDGALILARAALDMMPSERVIIDVPSSNQPMIDRLLSAGFESGFTTARMYRGPAPTVGPALQAIATMELG
ncbi:GNAT family N-acetyltransferase [Shimia abyssi]|uniref:Acetyltransferase (GNAT) family protein n=1 Tax=Shimia abyssi TaxID=1662395 RepID=A0A2P8FBS9_9RHOB|nr:GNAT family N-acetyltransferase [Shimia abyssi]PSL19197.1 acetyltransferase (GNAT) family protein [Shimia abyssi]